jgi:hypothetical protein
MMAAHTTYRRGWRCSGRIAASDSTTSRLEYHHILIFIVNVAIFLVLEKRLRMRLSICQHSRRRWRMLLLILRMVFHFLLLETD